MRARLPLLLAAFVSFTAVPTVTAQDTEDDAAQTVIVEFRELNDSGLAGTTTLTGRGDQTLLVTQVTGVTGEHPHHIHRGTCADPEPQPTYPLNDVILDPLTEDGTSETTVDVPLSTLRSRDEPYLLLIHKSTQEIPVYYACADLSRARVTTMPGTGSGGAIISAAPNLPWLLLGGATLCLLGFAVRGRHLTGHGG